MSSRFPPTLDVICPTCGARVGVPCDAVDGVTHVARANLIGVDFKPRRTSMTQHAFGPELGYKPTTYTCRCGFRSADYGVVSSHITDERRRLHEPRRLTSILAVLGSATPGSGIQIASTPHGDEADAVEVRLIVSDGEHGRYQHHMVLMSRASIPVLIAELEAHLLDRGDQSAGPSSEPKGST